MHWEQTIYTPNLAILGRLFYQLIEKNLSNFTIGGRGV